MAAEQIMMQTITQAAIKAAKAAIMTIKETENPVNAARYMQVMLRTGGPVLKQPNIDWKTADKYQELWNFEIEVKNIVMTITYKITRSPID